MGYRGSVTGEITYYIHVTGSKNAVLHRIGSGREEDGGEDGSGREEGVEWEWEEGGWRVGMVVEGRRMGGGWEWEGGG